MAGDPLRQRAQQAYANRYGLPTIEVPPINPAAGVNLNDPVGIGSAIAEQQAAGIPPVAPPVVPDPTLNAPGTVPPEPLPVPQTLPTPETAGAVMTRGVVQNPWRGTLMETAAGVGEAADQSSAKQAEVAGAAAARNMELSQTFEQKAADEAAMAEKHFADQQAKQAAFEKRYTAGMQNVDRLRGEAAAAGANFDKDHIWKSKNNFEKIATIIAAAGAGFAQIWTGQRNYVLDNMDKEIERDITAQRMQIADKRTQAADEMNMWQSLYQHNKSVDATNSMMYALKLDSIDRAINAKLRVAKTQEQTDSLLNLQAQIQEKAAIKRDESARHLANVEMSTRPKVVQKVNAPVFDANGRPVVDTRTGQQALEQMSPEEFSKRSAGMIKAGQEQQKIDIDAAKVAAGPNAGLDVTQLPGVKVTNPRLAQLTSRNPELAKKTAETVQTYQTMDADLQRMGELRQKYGVEGRFSSVASNEAVINEYNTLRNRYVAGLSKMTEQGVIMAHEEAKYEGLAPLLSAGNPLTSGTKVDGVLQRINGGRAALRLGIESKLKASGISLGASKFTPEK